MIIFYDLNNDFQIGVGVDDAEKTTTATQESVGAALVEPPFEGAEAAESIAEAGKLRREKYLLYIFAICLQISGYFLYR